VNLSHGRSAILLSLAFVLVQLGCSNDSSTSQKSKGKSEKSGSAAVDVTAASTDRQPSPDDLLERVIQRYQKATAYHDQGEVTLRYRANNRSFVDTAPYQVHFVRGQRLGLEVYQTRVESVDGRFKAKIDGSAVPELQSQFVDREIADAVNWDELTADQALHESMAQGLGRYPLVVELLLAPEPLAAFGDQSSFPRRLLDNEEIDGQDCVGLRMDTQEGPFDLWVDLKSLVVRRVVFPVEDIAQKMAAESGAKDIRVVAEFRGAEFGRPDSDDALPALEPGGDDHVVAHFVIPPEPLPTNLLGESMPAFELAFLDGQPFRSEQIEGKVAVFHWFVDHPSCQASLKLFDDVARRFAEEDNIEFYAVCVATDDTPVQEIRALTERWGVSVPILRDSDAVGRDTFQIPALPAIIAIGSDSRLQIYELTFIPKIDELLGEALDKLLTGTDLADEVLARFEEAQRRYNESLENM
jgi:peroxiredoxin